MADNTLGCVIGMHRITLFDYFPITAHPIMF